MLSGGTTIAPSSKFRHSSLSSQKWGDLYVWRWEAVLTLPSNCLPLCLEKEKDPKYWRDQAQETLKYALELQKLNTNVAKNVIMFLGDGEARGPVGAGEGGETGHLARSPGSQAELKGAALKGLGLGRKGV